MPLDPAMFEEKAVAIRDFLRQGQHALNPWTKIAYYSKRSDVVVFVSDYTIVITNISVDIDAAASFADIVL